MVKDVMTELVRTAVLSALLLLGPPLARCLEIISLFLTAAVLGHLALSGIAEMIQHSWLTFVVAVLSRGLAIALWRLVAMFTESGETLVT